MKKNREAVFFCLVAAVFFVNIPAFASAQEEQKKPFHVKTISRYIAESEVNAMPGEIGIGESKFSASYGKTLRNLLPVTVSFDYQHTDINENLAVELPSHLEARRLGFGTKFPLPFLDSENYYVGIDAYPSLYTDDWKWESGAFRMPFRTYLIYKPREEFVLVAGVSVRIDYDDVVLPLIGFIYKPNDRLSFNLASDEPNISYKLTNSMTAFAELDYTWEEYEVIRNGQKGVVLKYKQSSVGGGLKFTPNSFLEASLSGGGVLSRRLEYRDGTGKVEPDSAPYVKARMAVKF